MKTFFTLMLGLFLVSNVYAGKDKIILKSGKSVSGTIKKETKKYVIFKAKNGKTYKVKRAKIAELVKADGAEMASKEEEETPSRSSASTSGGKGVITVGGKIEATLSPLVMQIGGVGNYSLNKNMAIQGEIGASFAGAFALTVPVLFQWKFLDGQFRPQVIAGPYFGIGGSTLSIGVLGGGGLEYALKKNILIDVTGRYNLLLSPATSGSFSIAAGVRFKI